MIENENSPLGTRPGKRRFRAIIFCLILAAATTPVAAQRAVILVRHAEKADASKDPVLSEAGQARARALAVLLARAGVTAVYVSEYQRTKQTAEPLAVALNLPVYSFPAADPAGLVERLRALYADDVVLVVGHSDTLPDLMQLLGHPAMETIEDDDFGNVFVLVPRGGQPPFVVRFRY